MMHGQKNIKLWYLSQKYFRSWKLSFQIYIRCTANLLDWATI